MKYIAVLLLTLSAVEPSAAEPVLGKRGPFYENVFCRLLEPSLALVQEFRHSRQRRDALLDFYRYEYDGSTMCSRWYMSGTPLKIKYREDIVDHSNRVHKITVYLVKIRGKHSPYGWYLTYGKPIGWSI